VNTWLVYALALSWPRMRHAALWAAMFFAVQEGHQEAVMWFTAVNELLQFLFGMGALWCWMRAPHSRRRWPLEIAAFALYVLAMLSKESAVILPALFLIVMPRKEWRRVLPYLAITAVTFVSIMAARNSSFRFNDGSFSLHAPFWITWPRGIGRVLWFWGWLSLAVLAYYRRFESMLAPLAWIAAALVPYSFLTYSTQIPSRQTYLASVGLVLLFGLAADRLLAVSPKLVAAAIALMIVLNVGYLWTKKRAQFLERAQPTEQLIRLARQTTGPIWVQCFPRNRYIAEQAAHVGAGRAPSDLIWTAGEAAQRHASTTFCYPAK
jgi:hypothetical protein